MVHCKLAECTFSKDGRCLEGQGEKCPNLVPDDLSSPSPQPSRSFQEAPASAALPYVPTKPLYSGLPLEITEAQEFTG